MPQKFLGTGWKFPVKVNSTGGLSYSRYETDIEESIYMILGTSKGERVMRPDFGCGIHDFVFAPADEFTIQSIKYRVEEALRDWEPRIDLLNVDVSSSETERNRLIINIEYRIRSTNTFYNLVYPFYLEEG